MWIPKGVYHLLLGQVEGMRHELAVARADYRRLVERVVGGAEPQRQVDVVASVPIGPHGPLERPRLEVWEDTREALEADSLAEAEQRVKELRLAAEIAEGSGRPAPHRGENGEGMPT